ncbi:ThuA domain-containing protein [Limnoglobus roseus]|uniref:ThuA protein amidase n=1 Tax=Limnoglobus roseus TaxID=2598579 RepID=A0A5C1A8D3_9BACT|nr:isochorismatase family protein [Limnoglobus roseus]QEL14517.1 ThuA protein amidase [Limnoglobus roseus]
MARVLSLLLIGITSVALADDKSFSLNTRTRTETAPGSGRYHTVAKPATWDAAKTAVVICDMWDKHWCDGATGRVGEMAPRMNDLIVAARKRGALVIHCPSDTMAFYKDTPQRKLAMDAPKSEPKVPLERWCKLDPAKEIKLPIDDSDGGCGEVNKNYRAWTRQHEALKIEAGDAITDSEEAYHLMRQRGIENVVVMGVHTNMCVLGRPFAIRQLTKQGLNVVLVRDMTDTMYNPAKAPFVAHCTGTDLVVEHIEKHWCPTVTSVDFLGGKEFRFKEDKRPTLVIVSAEDEYKTETTLPPFALAQLGMDYRVSFVFADAKDKYHLPGIEQLNTADAVLFSVRRKPLMKADLDVVRKYVASGKPIIAIRTASHGFAPRKGESLPAGVEAWETFDKDILGCEYKNHYANALKMTIERAPADGTHSVLADWPTTAVESTCSLYRSNPLAADAIVLLTGKSGDNPVEPIAWVREKAAGRGRVFYASLGNVDDFKQEWFAKLLKNGIAWAAGK